MRAEELAPIMPKKKYISKEIPTSSEQTNERKKKLRLSSKSY